MPSDLEQTRIAEAAALWRAEAPDERATIEPDLGTVLQWLMDGHAELAEVTAELMDGRAELAAVTADLSRTEETLAQYQQLFALQWNRVQEATKLWRAEDPEKRANITPDLGTLVGWLMERAKTGEQTHNSGPGWHLDSLQATIQQLREYGRLPTLGEAQTAAAEIEAVLADRDYSYGWCQRWQSNGNRLLRAYEKVAAELETAETELVRLRNERVADQAAAVERAAADVGDRWGHDSRVVRQLFRFAAELAAGTRVVPPPSRREPTPGGDLVSTNVDQGERVTRKPHQ
jgi:hypothetical protein